MDVTKGDLGNLTFSFGINLAVLNTVTFKE